MAELATKQAELALPILDAEASPQEIMEALSENLGGEGLNVWDLDRVKIPSGGGVTWSVPTLEHPDGEDRKELVGVPVFWKYSRVYYEREMGDGENSRPDCQSHDAKWGVGNPGGSCADCPLSQWIDDRRPPCKQQVEVFLLTEDSMMPLVVILSPASIKPWKDFVKAIGMRGIPYYGAHIGISLVKDKNPGGITYSKVKVQFKEKLTKEQAAQLKQFKGALEPTLMRMPAEAGTAAPEATRSAPVQVTGNAITNGQVTNLQMRFNELGLSNDDRDLKVAILGNLLGRELGSSKDIQGDEFPALTAQLEALTMDVVKAGVDARGFLTAQTSTSRPLGDGETRAKALEAYGKVHGRMTDMFAPDADVPQF